LQKQATRRLGSRMVELYKDVVLACLTSVFGVVDDTKEDLKLQRASFQDNFAAYKSGQTRLRRRLDVGGGGSKCGSRL
jgi:hypothetical protein